MRTYIFNRVSPGTAPSICKALSWQSSLLRNYAGANNLNIEESFDEVAGDLNESKVLASLLDSIDLVSEKQGLLVFGQRSSEFAGPIDARIRDMESRQTLEVRSYSHPCFQLPTSGDAKLWRYLSFPKFADLLRSSRLYFSRVDRLREFDRAEGTAITPFHRDFLDQLRLGKIKLPDEFPVRADDLQEAHLSTEETVNRFAAKTFVNCWHASEHENFAMWKIYSDPTFGVCIQSTAESLTGSFEDERWHFFKESENRINMGFINYIDRHAKMIPQGNIFWPFMFKGEGFRYENEIRCLVTSFNEALDEVTVGVDLHRLIQAIYVSPFAPKWFADVVKDLSTKYGMHAVVRQSILLD